MGQALLYTLRYPKKNSAREPHKLSEFKFGNSVYHSIPRWTPRCTSPNSANRWVTEVVKITKKKNILSHQVMTK